MQKAELRTVPATIRVALSFCILCSVFCIVTSPASACTIGAFGPGSTADGRPMLWKNRDVSNPDQELRYFTDGKYRYVANVYAGESSLVWAGINERGFAVMNSNSFNIGGKADDDGQVMKLALAGCATVDDFAKLLDSLNVVGGEVCANFGAFDSTGATAMFEAANTYYVRYDAADDSLGFLLRANYSMHGDTSRLRGKVRYDRAMQLSVPARRENRIDAPFLVQTLCRDIGFTDFDPYPLPYESTYGSLPYGYLPADQGICRTTTRSVEIMVGNRPGEPASSGMMWILLGSPDVALPVPAWVQAGPVPSWLDGPSTAAICDEARALLQYVRSDPDHPEAVNTFCLDAVRRAFAARESTVFAMVGAAQARWPAAVPDSAAAAALTASVCDTVLAAYHDFWSERFRVGQDTQPRPELIVRPTVTPRRVILPLPESTNRVLVYDAMGRRVADFRVVAGLDEFAWDTDRLAAGTYQVVFGPGAGRSRFVILR
jgi:hypothetical protein